MGFRFATAASWWNGMNLRTRRDLIKEFGFRKRADFGHAHLTPAEQQVVQARFDRIIKFLEKEKLRGRQD